jgi:protease-4
MADGTRDILQQSIEHEYRRFITHVAKSRKQDVAAIDAIAQGRVWSGADAKRLGLVDQLGGYRDAIELAAKLAKLGKKYDVEYFDHDVGFGEAFGLRLESAMARILAPLAPKSLLPELLPRSLQPVVAELNRLGRLRDPHNTYMYCVACSLD